MSGFFTRMTYDRVFQEEGISVFGLGSMDATMLGAGLASGIEALELGPLMDQINVLSHAEDKESETLREAGKEPKQGIAEKDLPRLRLRYHKSADDQTPTQTACYEDFWASTEENPFLDQEASADRGPVYLAWLVQRWLGECIVSHHQNCPGITTATSWKPSRLINVQPWAESDDVRLEIRPNWSQDTALYVALSHCWGPRPHPQGMKTLIGTLDSQCERIKFSQLPDDFKEAVIITRKLNIDYLWIDSLCIVQDSQEDWQREAATVHEIYQNSTLTIASSSESVDTGGFFGPLLKLQEAGAHCRFYEEVSETSPYGKFFSRAPLRREWEEILHFGALHTRGWCLQERHLSQRYVHFSPLGLVWECATCIRHEKRPEARVIQHTQWPNIPITSSFSTLEDTKMDFESNSGYDIKRIFDGLNTAKKSSQTLVEIFDGKVDEDVSLIYQRSFLYERWSELVEDYTGRALTVDSDRLVAIAGLANALQAIVDDEYLVGLWKRDLARGLLWGAVARTASASKRERAPAFRSWRRHSEHIAPSWSWASVIGPVSFLHMNDSLQPGHRATFSKWFLDNRIGKIDVRTTGPNLFVGFAKDSSLVLSTFLREARVGQWHPEKTCRWLDGKREDGSFERCTDPECVVFPDIPSDDIEGLEVVCIEIIGDHYYLNNGGLVLIKSEGMIGAYQRIGLISHGVEWFDDCERKTITIV